MKILLGDLKDRAEELASFLEARVGTKPSSSGSEIEIEDSSVREGVRPRHVKTYIKRFLHKAGQRKAYRVLVAGNELSIVHLKGGPEEEEAPKAKETKEEPPTPEPAKQEEPKEKTEEKKPPEPKKRPRKAAKKPES